MRLSGYRIMWLFVFFDLPTETKAHRKAYTNFHKHLEKDGFNMLQYSVYIRHCTSNESLQVHIKKVETALPKEGKVSILNVTDKQFEKIIHYWGKKSVPAPEAPQQLEMF